MTIGKPIYVCLRWGLPITLLALGSCRQVDRISEDRQPESSQRIAAKLSQTEAWVHTDNIPSSDRGFSDAGQLVSETRKVQNFDRIRCSLGELIITQGDHESLTLTAEDRMVSQIVSEVQDGTLYLYPKNHQPFVTFDRIQFKLTLKTLEKLQLDGIVQVKADQLETDRLQLESSGSAQIEISSLRADTLQVDLGGSSELNLAGKVTNQMLRFSGGSRYRADLLESQTVALEINGAGEATVWANDRLDVQINGTGNVNFYGTPRVWQEIRGAGNVQYLGVPR